MSPMSRPTPLIALIAAFAVCCLGGIASAAQLTVPSTVTAGTEMSIPTNGSGEATLYVSGPGVAIKRKIQLGQDIQLAGNELRDAGRYIVSINGEDSASFFVVAGPLKNLAFLARPSRVPADKPNVISGTVFVFDRYQNLIMQPQSVKFDLSADGQNAARSETSKEGAAYVTLNSFRKDGAAQFVVSSDDSSVRRMVQQVASDPCSIRMQAQPSHGGILVTTDPIHDCAGNLVPDGTIVTFTSVDASGKSTVDARIKRGIAQAELPASNSATISVASGVVAGNEINWGGRR